MIVVVNDGYPYPSETYPSTVEVVIQHKRNKGIGQSKNDALQYLLKSGCEHIFLCEDDIAISDSTIFEQYIHASKLSGIMHLNFAYHDPRNKTENGQCLSPRKSIVYPDGTGLALHRHIVGAFQYFRREVLEQCGLMDPMYKNMWEHLDHTYRIIKKGYHPPFWWFADIAHSERFIKDLDPMLQEVQFEILHGGIKRS